MKRSTRRAGRLISLLLLAAASLGACMVGIRGARADEPEKPSPHDEEESDPQLEILLADRNFRPPWQPASAHAAERIAALQAHQGQPAAADLLLAASRRDRGSHFYGIGMWLIDDRYGPPLFAQQDAERWSRAVWHYYLGELREVSPEGARLAVSALSDPDPAVRWAAAGAFRSREARLGKPDLGRLLLRLASDPEPLLRQYAVVVAVFSEGVARTETAALARLARDPDPNLRWAGMFLCARDGVLTREAAIYFAARLRTGSALVRASAATALGLMTPASAYSVERLEVALEDGDASVRRAAARALERQGRAAVRARPALLRRLGDADGDVMEAAASALAAQAAYGPELVARLEALLRAGDPLVRRGAMEALQRARPHAAAAIARVIRGTYGPEPRLQAIQAAWHSMGTMEGGASSTLPNCLTCVLDAALATAVVDPDPTIREAALEARTYLGFKPR